MTDADLPAIGAVCIELLAAQAFFGAATEQSIKPLCLALRRGCSSLPHARAVLEQWTAQNREMPAPADLLALARTVDDPEKQAAPRRTAKPDCQDCGGTGWRTVHTLRTYELTEQGWKLLRNEWIPRERYDELVHIVDGNEQEVAEASIPCRACRGRA